VRNVWPALVLVIFPIIVWNALDPLAREFWLHSSYKTFAAQAGWNIKEPEPCCPCQK
jgi:hypothetical protein